MRDKIVIPNPFSFILELWNSTDPSTKKWIFTVLGAIIITAMITGNFDLIVGLFFDEAKK